MTNFTTAALFAALTASIWTVPSVVQGAGLSAMEGTWSARLGGGALAIAPRVTLSLEGAVHEAAHEESPPSTV